MNPSLDRLRRQLTMWYVGVFAVVLLLLGLSLLGVLTHQVGVRLDRSLESAADEVIRAAEIRERERELPAGLIVDAFEELRIPGRMLFVFDRTGALLHPGTVPEWVRPAVAEAMANGDSWLRPHAPDGGTYRVYARSFRLTTGGEFIAVAAADVVELREEYATLILAFGLAGVASIVLAALGGAALARRSTVPVQRAFEQMRRFMADAAHELRTPLTILHGRADVTLQRSRSQEEYEAALSTIRVETARMSAMIDRLLDLSRFGSGDMRERYEPVYLDDILLDAGEDARALAADRDVRVVVDQLDECPFRGDAHLLRQMFFNILDNAVRHSPDGAEVSASIVRENGCSTADIVDHGPGIASDALPHVFDPFYRVDPARSRKGGAGLGLAIAQAVADAHGAHIRIDCPAGAGTRVRIEFPAD